MAYASKKPKTKSKRKVARAVKKNARKTKSTEGGMKLNRKGLVKKKK